MRNHFRNLDPGYLVAALLPLVGILPTLSSGVIRTADGPLHVQRIYAMTTLLASGNLWPRWVPYFHLGYGYPIFNFYPPGTFYAGGLMGLAGIPAPLAFNILTTLAWMLGSVGMYGLARRFLPGKAALLAAMLWAYAPSRLFEVWDQGSLPQIMAAALVPWLFWGMLRLVQHPTRRGLLGVALPFAGIILSHQPITFITALYVAPAIIALPLWAAHHNRATFPPRLLHMVGGFALGVALAAIFLLPLAMELRYVEAVESPDDAVPYLISNFLQPGEVFMQPPVMDLTDLRFELTPTFGLVGGLLAAVGFVALVVRRYYTLAAVLALALAFTLFMLVEPSLPVWLTLPYLRQLRFPERFLRVGVIFLSLAGGASLLLLPRRWQLAGLSAGLLLVLVAALPLIYPNQSFVHWENLSALDEIEMEETYYIWGSTSYNEFNPVWGERIRHDPAPEPEQYIANPLRLTVFRQDMIRQWPDLQVEEIADDTIRVTVTDERPVRFRQYYFPGWEATLNGEPAEIYPEQEVGMIALRVPPGEHTVRLYYAGTTPQHIGALVTLAAVGLTAFLGLYRPQRRDTHADRPAETFAPAAAVAISAGVVAYALVNTTIIAPGTLWFRQQSPSDAPFYMQQHIGANFGDTFELLGYTLDQHSAAPGGLFSVQLFWRALRDFTGEEYRPVVQLINLKADEAWAVSEPFSPGGGSTTFGYPLDRFASEVHEMRLYDDAPPYMGRVLVKMLNHRTGEFLRLPDGTDGLILEPLVRVNGAGVNAAQRLNYRLGDSVELWCASVSHHENLYQIDLYWHVSATPIATLQTFVHGLGSGGEIVTQQDGETMGGDYPAPYWLPGQTLHDRYTLSADEALAQIAIGLYTPEGARLAVTQNGQPVPDDRVLLPLEEVDCLR